jgi:ribosomal protein S28E/S33
MLQTNVAVGDVVLLMDKRLHRSDWPKAIITKTATGPDGFVRTVRVRTSNGSEYDRDIQKLALLKVGTPGIDQPQYLSVYSP